MINNEKKAKKEADIKDKELTHYKGLSEELSEQIALSQKAENEYTQAMKIKQLQDEAMEREMKSYQQKIQEK